MNDTWDTHIDYSLSEADKDGPPRSVDYLNTSMEENEPPATIANCHVLYSSYYVDYSQLDSVRCAFIVMYCVVSLMSLLGNFMVIWTVFRNKHMRTVTNYYIVNLAVSDFLVTAFVMPLKLLEYTAPCSWRVFAKDALCSFLYYVLPVFVFASVLTLVAISMERYYAIVHPLSAMKVHSKSRTRKIVAATWIVPIVVALPYLYCKSYAFSIHSHLGHINRQICTDRFDDIDIALYGSGSAKVGGFRKGFFLFLFVTIYLLPMIIIVTTCVRIIVSLLKPIAEKIDMVDTRRFSRKREENKRKVARMVIVVAVAFIMAWSPFYLVTFVSQVQTDSFLKHSNFVFTMLAVHFVGFTNSCLNPFIYCFMSEKFRRSFKEIVLAVCCCCCGTAIRRYLVRNKLLGSIHESDYEYSEYNRDHTSGRLLVKIPGGANSYRSPDTTIIRMTSIGKNDARSPRSPSSPVTRFSCSRSRTPSPPFTKTNGGNGNLLLSEKDMTVHHEAL